MIRWNKICRVDNEACVNDVSIVGETMWNSLCRNIIWSSGSDSWTRKIKVPFENMKSFNFNGLSLLGLVDGHWRCLNRNVMVKSQICWCCSLALLWIEASTICEWLLKCSNWGAGEFSLVPRPSTYLTPTPPINISHAYNATPPRFCWIVTKFICRAHYS